MNKEKQANYAIACLLIVVAALCRLVPHPMNFTPVLAVALVGGATLPRRLAYAVPLSMMLISDVVLGIGWFWSHVAVYLCLLLGVLLGSWLADGRTPGRTVTATLGGSLLFYLVTNFLVWLGPPMPPPYDYPRSFAGLVKCYVVALPFFRNALTGDLCWTLGLFYAFDAARSWTTGRSSALRSAEA